MKKEILGIIKYPNFEVRKERHFYTNIKPFILDLAYTFDGKYIGDPDVAKHLSSKYGIDTFEYRLETSKVTSIGFCSKTQTWYGWSHRAIYRAIYGYRIGSNIGGKTLRTLEEAKQAAKDFAESVN